MPYLLTLMRPHQYVKNVFIFMPAFFASKPLDVSLVFDLFVAFVSFSFISSSVYIFNDLCDLEADRQHPKKRERPLASGKIAPRKAIYLMILLFFASILLMSFVSMHSITILLLYFVMNIAYSLKIKHIPILDINVIAIGFVMRLFVGAWTAEVSLSHWIVVMTFLLALFLALAKRRDDVIIFLNSGKRMRKVVDGYNLQFLDTAMAIMASVVIVAYISYVTSPVVEARIGSPYLYLTTGFVILGILRYLQITFVEERSGSPTQIVLEDRFLQLVLLAWVSTFAWILYL